VKTEETSGYIEWISSCQSETVATLEREIARQVIYDWNAAHAESEKAVLQPIGWETHSYPEMGEPSQEIINRLVIKSDILVAIFWSRLGSPTGVAASGTIEEIEKHFGAKIPTMIYFSNALLPHRLSKNLRRTAKRTPRTKKMTATAAR